MQTVIATQDVAAEEKGFDMKDGATEQTNANLQIDAAKGGVTAAENFEA